MHPYSARMTDAQAQKAIKIGGGDLSVGTREAIDKFVIRNTKDEE